MLPNVLLWLISATLVIGQSRPQLALNTVSAFTDANPSPSSFALPVAENLTITIAICSAGSNTRFFITNSSSTANDPGDAGGVDVFEVPIFQGYGNWTGIFTNGGVLAIQNADRTSFEVGVSDQGPIHEILSIPPLIGDTTSNQAILFSYPFDRPADFSPKYPNYTLPLANLSIPSPPTSSPNLTLIISLTSSSPPLTALPQSACMLSSQQSSGTVVNETLWLRDQLGWRNQWLIAGLTPFTNYTAYVVQDNRKVSGPLFFATKSPSFACPLVHSLPYCPGVSYTIPLPPPPAGDLAYTAQTVPNFISDPLLSYLTNFTTSLTTFACGRDLYSPLQGCSDCQREYRRWLCTISFPRCGEASPNNADAVTRSPAPPSATGLSAIGNSPGSDSTFDFSDEITEGSQVVFSALAPQSTASVPRNPFFPPFGTQHNILLPCIEVCTAVDRACPAFLGFQCPTKRFNAAASYGVGYIDGGDGTEGQGATGTSQDVWGNIWCNGS